MKKILSALLTLLLIGCAYHQTPYPMYEGSPSLSNTAVFAVLDDKATKHNESRIVSVNGKEPSCTQVGCPYWVRVLPGNHKFVVRYTSSHYWGKVGSGYKYADLTVEVSDMKPKHVYVARYQELSDQVKVVVEDMGENSGYGIPLYLDKKIYRAEF